MPVESSPDFEFNSAVDRTGLESFLDHTLLELHLAGTSIHTALYPVDRRKEHIPSYTLWFVKDATYLIETESVQGVYQVNGGVLFRPGSFFAHLIRPQAVSMLYVRLNVRLFGALDLFRLFEFPQVFELPHPSRSRKYAEEAIEEYRLDRPAARMAGHGLLLQSLAWLIREVFAQELPPSIIDPPVLKAIHHIHMHIDEPLQIRAIAKEVGCHPSHLSRLFRSELGQSPAEFIRLVRIDRAKRLLVDTELSIAQVAERVGYPDPSHFSRVFLEEVGMRPSTFRTTAQLGG
ncbi:MAG: helix-turn-helix domain-containing protein [Limnochordia bacterium]|jgi:AraC-like DNA-binding protein